MRLRRAAGMALATASVNVFARRRTHSSPVRAALPALQATTGLIASVRF